MRQLFNNEIMDETVKLVAKKMLLAAKTAPKGKGADNLVACIVDGNDISSIADKLRIMASEHDMPAFARDADNILSAACVILLGTKIRPLGLKKCGLCGFVNCEKKMEFENVPCAFNSGDLGIAIGSAVSIAADARVDNRIMYTVGQAVLELGLLGDDVKIIYAIPLSASGKNPFFDRLA